MHRQTRDRRITSEELLSFPGFTADEMKHLSLDERRAFIDLHVHCRIGDGTSAMAHAAEAELRTAIVASRVAAARADALRAQLVGMHSKGHARRLPDAIAGGAGQDA